MIEKIDYSPTFSGVASFMGFFVVAIGLISLAVVFNADVLWIFFSIPVTCIGVLMILNLRGVLIDYSSKKIKFYSDFIFFKTGEWISIEGFDKIQILYDYDINNSGTSMSGSRFYRTKLDSYEICLFNSVNKKIVLKELSNPVDAKKIMKNISEKLKIPYPEVEIIRERMRA